MHLTAKERILLYLFENTPRGDVAEVPRALTREGVARASLITPRHLAQYVEPLVRDGLVRERQAHVDGIRQRRKVYDLTESGKRTALQLRQSLQSELVRVSDVSGVRETTVSQALEALGGQVPLSSLVVQAIEHGTIDLQNLQLRVTTPQVEMLTDAPGLEGFTGRREEVRAIVEESGRHQVYVIQGVAGIGKSSLAAKACEVERGKRNIFWHKVRSWDTDLTMFAALGEFLRALDRPALESVMKRGEAHRAPDILRKDLPGIRSMLVFDDVHEASPGVLAFLGLCKDALADAPDVRVLVLTRRKVPFYDSRDVALTGMVREINLGGLHPEDVAAMFADRQASPKLLQASRRLHGHPLLCQLLLTAGPPSFPARLPRDVHRFIEEQVYAGLTPEEGTVLKILSLFGVPVPRAAVLASPRTTAEAFHALVGRFLVRPVGEETFEVHDTVRDFFLEVLAPAEQEELGAIVLDGLRRLASNARDDSDFGACVDYLSSALTLRTSPADTATLHEALGDAYAGRGDLAGALVAYRMSARTTEDLGRGVRLRRKTAEVLFAHGEFLPASAEAEAAVRTMEADETPERGWLQLVRCQVAIEREDFALAVEYGEDALRVFRRFGVLRGEALAYLALGRSELLWGKPSVRESASMTSAMELATCLADPQLLANVHLAMADIADVQFADPERALGHLAAIESLPAIMDDPAFACRLFWTRGWIRILLLNEQSKAMEDFVESLRLARRLHDVASVGQAQFGVAMVHLISTRIEEARAGFEAAAAIFQNQGLPALEYNAAWLLVECLLMQGDLDAFRRTLPRLDELQTAAEAKDASSSGVRPLGFGLTAGLHGFDHLLRGHAGECQAAFRLAVRIAEGDAALRPSETDVTLPSVLLWYGMAMRAMGHAGEGDGHFARGLEVLRARHLEGARFFFESAEIQRFQKLLTDAWHKAVHESVVEEVARPESSR